MPAANSCASRPLAARHGTCAHARTLASPPAPCAADATAAHPCRISSRVETALRTCAPPFHVSACGLLAATGSHRLAAAARDSFSRGRRRAGPSPSSTRTGNEVQMQAARPPHSNRRIAQQKKHPRLYQSTRHFESPAITRTSAACAQLPPPDVLLD